MISKSIQSIPYDEYNDVMMVVQKLLSCEREENTKYQF